MTHRRPRLIIADDHRLLVEGLQQTLGRNYDVVGVAYTGEEALEVAGAIDADCLLLDISLPGRNGLDILPDLLDLRPGLRVVVLTMHADRVLADASLAAGAMGFVPKDAGTDEVQTALGEALKGRRYISPRVPQMSRQLSLDARHLALARLTPRQQEVIRLLGEGLSSAEVGEVLGVSRAAVTGIRTRIREVLGLSNEFELVRFAILVRMATDDTPAASPP